MNPAELRRRLHDVLGPGQPPPDLAARALAHIEARPRAPHAWAVGVAVAVVLFAVVFAGAFAARSLHSSPRAARPSPSAPLAIGGGVPSDSPTSCGSATPAVGVTATPSPSGQPTSGVVPPSPTAELARNCTAGDLRLTTRTDSTDYAVGQSVHLSSDERNVSSSACVVRTRCTNRILVEDGSGHLVFPQGDPAYEACAYPQPHTLTPGAVMTITATWFQRYGCNSFGDPCTGNQVPPGTYSAHGSWAGVDASPVSFVIGPVASCAASDVSVAASTDHTAYARGATVTVTATITDKASHPCSYARGMTNPTFSIGDAAGTVWTPCDAQAACSDYLQVVVIFPGQGDSVTATWNQQSCSGATCTAATPGPYQASVTFRGLGSATADFVINAT